MHSALSNRPAETPLANFAHANAPLLMLGVALAAAAAFRLYGLAEQSLYFDEINSIALAPGTSFADHLARIRLTNPDHVPLYFLLNHAWTKIVSASIAGQRLFPLLLDLLSVLLVYRVAAFSGRRFAPPIAALLYALSIYHIYTAQSLRPYSLVVFLALLATWQVLRFLTGPANWAMLVPLVLTYSVLIWTHLSGALILSAHLLVLIVFNLRDRRALAIWSAVGVALACELALALGFIRSVQAIAEPSFTRPTVGSLYKYVFCFDRPVDNIELLPGNFTHPGPLAPLADRANWLLPLALGLAYGLPLIGLGGAALRSLARKRAASAEDRATVLYLACVIVPIAEIVLISMTATPLLMPRFAVASTVFFYILFACAVSHLPARVMAGLAGVLIGFYGIQAMAMAQTATRTEFKQACDFVRANRRDGDLFLCREATKFTNTAAQIVTQYIPDVHPMTAASILQGADFAHQFLSLPGHKDNSVWFAVQHGFTAPDLYDVEQIMDDTRLDVERADFPAMENLTLYRFQNPKTPDPEAVTVREALKRRAEPQDFEAAMASVGVQRDAGTWVENLVAFEYAFDLRALAPPKNPHELGQILLSLLATSVEVAYPLAQHAVARYPENGSCQLALSIACMERGEVEDARRAFGRCGGLADILSARHPLLGLTQAMAAGDCARMADALEGIRKLGNLEIGRLAWDRPSLLRECVDHACPQTAGASRP